jgi:MFS transporter, putative metabolite:H+ symporter
VWILRRNIPESPSWLEAVGRMEEANAIVTQVEKESNLSSQPAKTSVVFSNKPTATVPDHLLFSSEYRKRTIKIWLFQILQTIGYYGFGSLVPMVLAAKG